MGIRWPAARNEDPETAHMSAIADKPKSVVEVGASDLPLHCPTSKTPVWSLHPRVFLDVTKSGEVLCPYCSTRYLYKGGPVKGH